MSNENKDLVVKQTEKIPGFSTNKMLYLLVVEDPTIKAKSRSFVTSRVDKNGGLAEIIGYEITDTQKGKLKNWKDATELAKKEKMEMVSMSFPWHRVVSIKNVSYKPKNV